MTAPPPLCASNALFLDFDGTLAPLQDAPAGVFLSERASAAIAAANAALRGALAIVSGRDLRDLATRTPGDVWRAGGHGLEICPPFATPAAAPPGPPSALEAAVEAAVAAAPGTVLERKGPILAIHYRSAPAAEATVTNAVKDAVSGHSNYVMQIGKMVVEAKPADAHKGTALKWLMGQGAFAGRKPIMVGDDVTDEDAFAAAIEMGGFAIKVGEGASAAQHRLSGPDALADWINHLTE
ncbi:MAG: trehalose-phosphatase [Pseudomonadota bacterium]